MDAHAPHEVLHYGPGAAQQVELRLPDGVPHGLAVLVHGGYWRSQWTADLMLPLAADLQARGWASATVEYRSVGNGGGWPITLEDVRRAVHTVLAVRARTGIPSGPIVGVGHSAGGQLALLCADLLDAVVGLAPVTDLVRVDGEHLDDDAAAGFMGGPAAELPAAYAQASPIRRLPLNRPMLVLQGDGDVWVPADHTRAFVHAAHEAGERIDYREVRGLDHMAAIDPAQPFWPAVVEWMSAQPQRMAERVRRTGAAGEG